MCRLAYTTKLGTYFQVPRPFEQVPEDELVREFLQDPKTNMAPTSFRMDSLLREMQEIEGSRLRHAPLQGPHWVHSIFISIYI